MERKNGGARTGSGRKSAFHGEKTELIRIPESKISLIKAFLEAYKHRKENTVGYEERFVYALAISRLKMALNDTINFLRTSFRSIPVVSQQINVLQDAVENTNVTLAMPYSPTLEWEHINYSPSGLRNRLLAKVENKRVRFFYHSDSRLKHDGQSKTEHALTLEETDALIAFLLNARQFIE